MYKYAILTFLILTSCSKENLEFNVPTTSEVEKLIKHSDEFNQEVITFDTPGGKIHFAIGFGIANSIMVEGQDGNIIIDAADSRYDAEKIYKLFIQVRFCYIGKQIPEYYKNPYSLWRTWFKNGEPN